MDAGLIRIGVIVLLGVIVAGMDGTMMVVAIDAIGHEFMVSTQTVQWVTGAYLLANGAAIPVSGYLVDRFGARTIWLLSLAGFLVASILCALAWSAASLIGFRVLQGFAGGLIGMAATIVLTRAAGPERAGRAFSMIAVPSSLAPVFGPILAGLLVDAAGWRWLFNAQVPLLAASLVAAWIILPREAATDKQSRLDWLGFLLVVPGLSLLVYGLSKVADSRTGVLLHTMTDPSGGGAIIAGLLLTAGFIVHALQRRERSIIDLRLFANKGFSVATSLLFVVGFLLYGLLFLVPLYYQQVVGLSATAAGALLAPQGAGIGLAAIFVGSLNDRFGARPVVLTGLALTMLGTVAFTSADAEPNGVVMAISLALRGVGLAAVSIPLSATLYQLGMPQEAIPHIATASAVVMRLGGTVGGAAAAVSLQLATPVGVTGSVPASAFATTFWWMTGLLVAPFLLALFLPGKRRIGAEAPESSQAVSVERGSS